MTDKKRRLIEVELSEEEIDKLRGVMGGDLQITTTDTLVSDLLDGKVDSEDPYDRNFDKYDRVR